MQRMYTFILARQVMQTRIEIRISKTGKRTSRF